MRLKQKKMPLYLRLKFYHECLRVKLKNDIFFQNKKHLENREKSLK